MSTRYYTGVGSRAIPVDAQGVIVRLAANLACDSWVLRSGAADGADAAFEYGALAEHGDTEIYLPWKGFNGHRSSLYLAAFTDELQAKAAEIARTVHPNWRALSPAGKKLHARNVFQVLGRDLESPSDRLIYWTPGGRCVGGTATAIRVAEMYGVEVENLGGGNGT